MASNNNVVISKLEVLELSGGGFFVAHNDRYGYLSTDEALMAVAHFMITKQPHHWLKSKSQREQEDDAALNSFKQRRLEASEVDLRKVPAFITIPKTNEVQQ